MIENVLLNLKSIGIFTIILSILIIVHEWGHFITAKLLGVEVKKFSLGFGPKLFSKFHNGTEFLICAVPLGGYVKMAGDERSECRGTPEEFFSKSPGHRALIVFNGPLVNFILAYVCFVFVFIAGYPELSPKIGELVDGYPGQEAGLRPGDRITRIDSKEVATWNDVQENISQSSGDQIAIRVTRNGEEISKAVTPRVEKRKNIFGQMKEVRLVGIVPSEDIIYLKFGPGDAFIKAYQKLVEIIVLTGKSLYYMVTGSLSPKESVAGPVGIFILVKQASEMGLIYLLLFLGVISANLAIFNLLPVIPLDGGHLFLLAIEKARGKALPPKVDEYIIKIGLSLIICLALFAFYNDFSRLGWIEKIKEIFF